MFLSIVFFAAIRCVCCCLFDFSLFVVFIHTYSCASFSSLFVAIAIEAFNKLGTIDEEQPLRPQIERQPSDPPSTIVDVWSLFYCPSFVRIVEPFRLQWPLWERIYFPSPYVHLL